MTLVEGMFRRFMQRQQRFFEKLPNDARKHLADTGDKYAELRVTGPEGGLFCFRYKGGHFEMLDEAPPIPRHELDKMILDGDMLNYPSGDEVFFDVIDGELSPRAVIARKYFYVNTNKVIYDTEEFANAFELFLSEMRKVLGRKSVEKS